MKIVYLLFIGVLFHASSYAQTCTIQISYDDNGNRILRELVCVSPKPQEEDNPDPKIPRNGQSLLTDTTVAVKGTFAAYPNPATNQVFVSLNPLFRQQPCTIVLLDQLGREHFRKEEAQALTTLSLEHLPDGLYYIILWRGKQQNTIKIVKQEARETR